MMTAREIAEKCNVPYNFVRNLCVKKKIVFVEAGRKRLINLEKFADVLWGCVPNE